MHRSLSAPSLASQGRLSEELGPGEDGGPTAVDDDVSTWG
jgi:hypothetical protein